jgi:hypothetical protein
MQLFLNNRYPQGTGHPSPTPNLYKIGLYVDKNGITAIGSTVNPTPSICRKWHNIYSPPCSRGAYPAPELDPPGLPRPINLEIQPVMTPPSSLEAAGGLISTSSGGSRSRPGIALAVPKPGRPLISKAGMGDPDPTSASTSARMAGVPAAGVPIAVVVSPNRFPISSSRTPHVSG